MTSPSPHRTSAFKGAILTVGMRWTDRLIGLLSTLVLARLLAPGDFGLVAMAMIVVGLIDVLLDLGVGSALIQNRAAGKADFDTAWTLRLCQAALAATIIAVGAPLVAEYYNDQRVVDILRVIAISVLVGGFENIGIVGFQRDMEFGRDFRFFLTKRVVGTVVTIALAFSMRSYWALVLGSLWGRFVGVTLSYVMHEFRPRISFERIRAIWSFSQWNIVQSIAGYMTNRMDQFVLGRRSTPAVVGAYSIGDEIASMPTTEILAPLGRVMFPAFAMAKHDMAEFRRIVVLSFSIQALVGIPAGVGIALVAQELVPLLLGAQWLAAIPLIQVLGFVGVATSMVHSGHYALLALGRVKALSMFTLVRFLLLLSVLVVAFPRAAAQEVAELRLAVALVALVGVQFLVRALVPGLGPLALFAEAWRPAAGALVMVPAVLAAGTAASALPDVLTLGIKLLVGVVTYTLAVAVTWRFVGRPAGAESYLLEKIRLTGLLGMSAKT